MKPVNLLAICLLLSFLSMAQSNTVSTIAGIGVQGHMGDGGAATAARIDHPRRTRLDSAGNLYFMQFTNVIRRVDMTTGIISHISGNHATGFAGDGGLATNATMNSAQDFVIDSVGNIYIADRYNFRIRKVEAATGIINTVFGDGQNLHAGDGGPAATACFKYPTSLAFDSQGNLYVAGGDRIRKIDQGGTVTTICGTGVAGFSGDGGPAASAAISFVFDMVFDKDDNLFILFTGRMRKIDASTGIISTLLGDGTLGNTGDGGSALLAKTAARSLAVDDHGNIFLSEFNNSVIRLLNSQGIIDRIGGTTVNGYSGDGGAALLADFNHPDGMALDSCGNMYIADAMNHRIRKVTYTTCDPLVIPDLQAGPSFGVYPNPVVSTLTITSPDRPAQVSISSSMGQVVMSNSHYAEKIVLNVAALVSGVYFLTLTSSDGHKQTKKIIKE